MYFQCRIEVDSPNIQIDWTDHCRTDWLVRCWEVPFFLSGRGALPLLIEGDSQRPIEVDSRRRIEVYSPLDCQIKSQIG